MKTAAEQWLHYVNKLVEKARKVLFKIKGIFLNLEHKSAKWLHPLNSRGQILFRKDYDKAVTAQNICIFSHFDKDGVIDEYVWRYFDALKAAGCAIVLVTTSPRQAFLRHLPEVEARLAKVVETVIVRKNIGKDFGSYFIGLQAVNLKDYQRLIFCNDSMYGPFRSLKHDFEVAQDYDVWGYTDSWELNYHLQSYFIAIKLSDRALQGLKTWQDNFLYYRARSNIVYRGELKLAKLFASLGLRVEALYPDHELKSAVTAIYQAACQQTTVNPLAAYIKQYYHEILGARLNPTHAYWLILLQLYRFPFIKRELVDKNPLGLAYVDTWPNVVQQEFAVDAELYLKHRKRVS